MRSRLKALRIVSLLLLVLGGIAASPALAQRGSPAALGATGLSAVEDSRFDSTLTKYTPASTGTVGVVITMDDAPLASYNGGIAGLAATNPAVTGRPLDVTSPESRAYLAYINAKIDRLVSDLQARISGVTVSYRYDIVLGGIAAQVPAAQVTRLRGLPNVDLIAQDRAQQLETERSPQFMGATTAWNQLGGQKKAGEGVIVGVLDSGIWPEHPSMSDPDPWGKPYAAPPGGPFACEFGSAIPNDAPFTCNNKLIGGYRFMDTYDNFGPPLLPGEFLSARDDNGHGTHTATTAAGNGNVQAAIFGVPRGAISGVAPRAHVIAYKVCGDAGCYSSDSAAAIQQAILDGADVLNFSISGGSNPYADIVSLAFLDAYNAGIFVAASAGNAGPGADTVDHREPWTTTVAASTADRQFVSDLTLTAAGGASLTVPGSSVTQALGTPTDVAFPQVGNELCLSPIPSAIAAGKVVLCQRGPGRVAKGKVVFDAGGAGMILYNNPPLLQGTNTDNHFLPTVHIESDVAAQVLAFIGANSGVKASFTLSTARKGKGDVMTSFSSRGGPGQTLGISKPDVTAPGIQILAGHTPLPVDVASGPQGELFQAIAGTSMSSPHVAGAAALMKDLHPNWTPGQIKSALMTSSSTHKLVKEDGVTPFTPFDAGSGRVDLRKSGNPGLLFAESGANYLALKDELWKANYPSLYVPAMPGAITVKRTAQDVTGHKNDWKLSVTYPKGQPRDFKVSVPDKLRISPHGHKTFEISLDARDVPLGEVRFATIYMVGHDNSNQTITTHFPVTIVRGQAIVSLEKSCDPASIKRGATTTCTITATNGSVSPADVTITDKLPRELALIKSSVTGASATYDRVSFSGSIPGRQPTNVAVAIDPLASFAGYVPLAGFGGTTVLSLGDESISNLTLPVSFTLGGNTYDRIGVVSNGYIVLGGGTNNDIDYSNFLALPNPAPPNNILAPFWTDLNPSAGGRVLINFLSAGAGLSWMVIEFERVPAFSNPSKLNTFQIWINYEAPDDVAFVYGPDISDGDNGILTVGAENEDGTRGGMVFFSTDAGNGVGTPPAPSSSSGYEVDVAYTQGESFSHVISFQARGDKLGKWVNYAELRAPDLFDGTSIARFAGEVRR